VTSNAILFVEKGPHDRRALKKDKEDFAQVAMNSGNKLARI